MYKHKIQLCCCLMYMNTVSKHGEVMAIRLQLIYKHKYMYNGVIVIE